MGELTGGPGFRIFFSRGEVNFVFKRKVFFKTPVDTTIGKKR